MTEFLLATWLTFSGTDAVTTLLAVNAGAHESNPLLRKPWALVTLKTASGVSAAAWTHHAKPDHPKIVRWVALGATVAYAGLTVHNYQVYQRQKARHR